MQPRRPQSASHAGAGPTSSAHDPPVHHLTRVNFSSTASPYSQLPYSFRIPFHGRQPKPPAETRRPLSARPTSAMPHYAMPVESAQYAQPAKPARPMTARPASARPPPASAFVPTTRAPTPAKASYEIHRPRRKHHTTDEDPEERPTWTGSIMDAPLPIPSQYNLNHNEESDSQIAAQSSYALPSQQDVAELDFGYQAAAVAPPSTFPASVDVSDPPSSDPPATESQPLSPNSLAAALGFGNEPVRRPKPRPRLPPSIPVIAEVPDHMRIPPPPAVYESSSSVPGSAVLSPDDSKPPLPFVVDWTTELRLATQEELIQKSPSPGIDSPEAYDAASAGYAAPEQPMAAPVIAHVESTPLFIRQKQAGLPSGHAAAEAEEKQAHPYAVDDYDADEFVSEDGAQPATQQNMQLQLPPPAPSSVSSYDPTGLALARIRARSSSSRARSTSRSLLLSRSLGQVERFLVGQVGLANEIAREYGVGREYRAWKMSVETAVREGADGSASSGKKDAHSVQQFDDDGNPLLRPPEPESKFLIRVYQLTQPPPGSDAFLPPSSSHLRSVGPARFHRELRQLLQRRDARERTRENQVEGERRRHVTTEGKDESRRVAKTLKQVMQETIQMTEALKRQVELLKAKGIRPIHWKGDEKAATDAASPQESSPRYTEPTVSSESRSPRKPQLHPSASSSHSAQPSPSFAAPSSARGRPMSAR
jgi:hypothetical protein